MTGARQGWPAQLLHFWFHQLRPDQWFGRNADVDSALRRRFAPALRALARRPACEFLRDPLMHSEAIAAGTGW